MRMSVIYKLSNEEFCELVKKSKSLCDIVHYFGLSINGSGGFQSVKRRIRELNIDCSHIEQAIREKRQILHIKRVKRSFDNILVENSTYVNTHSLKKRLIREGTLTNKCYMCGIDSWNGKILSLHLDHINGNRSDNRIENLRLLCPNCHSQTETYAGKNNKTNLDKYCEKCGKKICFNSNVCKSCHADSLLAAARLPHATRVSINTRKVKERPSREQLEKDIREIGWLPTGRKYGVSDNAIRKWSKSYGLNILSNRDVKRVITPSLCDDFKINKMTVVELAGKYGVSKDIVRGILYENNLLIKNATKVYKYGASGIIYDGNRGDYSCYIRENKKDKFLKRGFKTAQEAIDYRNGSLMPG